MQTKMQQVVMPLRMTPGTFFETDNGQIHRLEAIDGPRWTIRIRNGTTLSAPRSIVSDFPCTILSEQDVFKQVLGDLYVHAFETEKGSEHGDVDGNDLSGSSWYTASTIIRKKRFLKRFRAPPEWITMLAEMWGWLFIREFFVGMKTVGGYFPAKQEEFDASPSWRSPGLSGRSGGGEDGDEEPLRIVERERPYRKGSVPDLDAFQDLSRPTMVISHLRRVTDTPTLEYISKKARCRAVREAATIVLKRRLPRSKSASRKRK